MTFETFIRSAITILPFAIGIVFLIKLVIFSKTRGDNAPSHFFFNELYAIHATSRQSLKRNKRLQNKLSFYLFTLIGLLVLVFLIKFLLNLD